MSITYYEGVFVALGIQHATHMRCTVIFGLSDSNKFFHNVTEHNNVCFDFTYNSLWNISRSKKN